MIWEGSSVSLIVILIITCFQSIEATECTTQSVAHQTDADAITVACTSINGDLLISSNYEGSLDLPGVVNISGAIEGWNATTPYLTSITFEDLVSVGSIELWSGSGTLQEALYLVDFPSLTSIGNLSVNGQQSVNISLPFLQSGARIDLTGIFSSVSLPKLQAVEELFSINTSPKCFNCPEIIQNYPQNLLNVTIPSLITTKRLLLRGNFSSISFPNLETVQDAIMIGSEQVLNVEFNSLQKVSHGISLFWALNNFILPYYNSSLSLSLDLNTPLNIDIPSPGNISSINITGNCSLIKFPSLTSFAGDMSIEDNITSVSFPYLISVIGSMSFTGYISSLIFPALIFLNGPLTIISNTTIDCDEYTTLYQNATEFMNNPDGERFPFTCQESSVHEKDVKKKLEIGLGIGLGAGLLGGLILCRIKRRRNKFKERLKKIRELQMELEMRDLSRSATLVGTIQE